MKTKLRLLMVAIGIVLLHIASFADNEDRKLPVFTEISLRVPGKLYIQQGDVQKVTIDAKSSTLNDIITEVNGRALIIRFPAKNYLWKTFDPGSIIIHVTIPEISGLNVSGSGDIIGEGTLSALIMDVIISGSGNINLPDLKVERIKTVISGSGNISLNGSKVASEFTGTISGSGNIKAQNLEAEEVKVTISGSGNCSVKSNGHCNVRIAGSGSFYYNGNPSIDSTIAGSGNVKEIK
jgi:hypothetical protein